MYYLLGLVESSQYPDYFYVKKIDKNQLLESVYDGKLVELDDSVMNHLTSFYDKLLESHTNIVSYWKGYYNKNINWGIFDML